MPRRQLAKGDLANEEREEEREKEAGRIAVEGTSSPVASYNARSDSERPEIAVKLLQTAD